MSRFPAPPPDHWDWFYRSKKKLIISWVAQRVYQENWAPEHIMFPDLSSVNWGDPMPDLLPTNNIRLNFHWEYGDAVSTDGTHYWRWLVGEDQYHRFVSLPAERMPYPELPSRGAQT